MADLYTAEAVMEHWDKNSTKEQKDERYRIEQIKKDRDTARKYIKDMGGFEKFAEWGLF